MRVSDIKGSRGDIMSNRVGEGKSEHINTGKIFFSHINSTNKHFDIIFNDQLILIIGNFKHRIKQVSFF